MAVPVEVVGHAHGGVLLRAGGNVLPLGQRRAGLTAHAFSHHGRGDHHGEQERLHTGWLEVDTPATAVYRPHNAVGWRMPPSTKLYRFLVRLSPDGEQGTPNPQ